MDGANRTVDALALPVAGTNQRPASFRERVKHMNSGARLPEFETPP